ncbi:hypothetical protein BpHYR1_046847 [Brachionus plicatilis]|uniref:Uncharacterized protein n=1 Tax=Brachionus plicatilis TaxID=10195 RepID=A0A3M7RH53_BRAPC|nr:hypothetical protein BpHYR1_046847 [Brachionus plicatilis]
MLNYKHICLVLLTCHVKPHLDFVKTCKLLFCFVYFCTKKKKGSKKSDLFRHALVHFELQGANFGAQKRYFIVDLANGVPELRV